MDEIFDLWPTLKEHHGPRTLIVFLRDQDAILVNDDALEACQAIAKEDDILFTPAGVLWRFPVCVKALILRQVEAHGYKMHYAPLGASQAVRPEKVRVINGTTQLERDPATGRVQIGLAGMGSLWFDPKDKFVWMRNPNGSWLGHFCTPQDWAQTPGITSFHTIGEAAETH